MLRLPLFVGALTSAKTLAGYVCLKGVFYFYWSRVSSESVLSARGYCFVSLEASKRDPAYLCPDTLTGRFWPSWIHRWALAEKKPKEFYEDEPVVPKWVLDLAEVESE